MWAYLGAATAGKGVEDITLIIMTHPISFPCLGSPNRFPCLEKREPAKIAS